MLRFIFLMLCVGIAKCRHKSDGPKQYSKISVMVLVS
jgi:hypothetical protein